MKKTLLKITGYTAVVLGFAGAFLPILPTTPFLLLALYCFSKSSPRMNAWLLQNRMFGRYLNDYEQGRGIPRLVKASSLLILWSSILFTTILFINLWWLQGLLLLMAVFVSIHILHIRTRHDDSRILVLSPTAMESEKFASQLPADVAVEIIGIGPYHGAYQTHRYLLQHRPRTVILAGIAGSYPGSGLKTGDTVLVETENAADMGSFSAGVFSPKFSERLTCPHIPIQTGFRTAESNSLSAAAAPFADKTNARIENMEGAAFFYACLQNGIPFLELRTVSNIVGEDFCNWDIETATTNLARDLNTLIDELEA